MNFTSVDAIFFEEKLTQLGYSKYLRGFENSDYCYWKKFEKQVDRFDDDILGYQIGFAFYDFSKYSQFEDPKPIHISYQFILGNNPKINRLDITISHKKMSIEEFEEFCKGFYELWLNDALHLPNDDTQIIT